MPLSSIRNFRVIPTPIAAFLFFSLLSAAGRAEECGLKELQDHWRVQNPKTCRCSTAADRLSGPPAGGFVLVAQCIDTYEKLYLFRGKRELDGTLLSIYGEEDGFSFAPDPELVKDDSHYKDPFAHGPLSISSKAGIPVARRLKPTYQCREARVRLRIEEMSFFEDPDHFAPTFIERASVLSPVTYRKCPK